MELEAGNEHAEVLTFGLPALGYLHGWLEALKGDLEGPGKLNIHTWEYINAVYPELV